LCTYFPRAVGVIFVIGLGLLGIVRPLHSEAAFAFAQDTAGRAWFGFATNEATKGLAASLAMQRCSASGPGCQLVRQFSMGCLAYAAAVRSNAAGFGAGFNTSGAGSRALTECAKYSRGEQCVVRHSFCDAVSEQLVAATRRISAERNEQLQRHVAANVRGQSCNLSAKAISYTFQFCTEGSSCRPMKSYLEIVGNQVLYQQNPTQGGSGFTFQLGRTVDVTQEASQLPGLNSDQWHMRPKWYATASFDGQELTLRMDIERYTQSHPNYVDNILFSVSTITERIAISQCNACALREFRISDQNAVLPGKSYGVSNQPCEMASMK
jgi:hypothetical protein